MSHEKSYDPLPPCEGDAIDDVKRYLRVMPPADYTLEIDSFSDLQKMLKESGAKSYESLTFEAGGYKWKLSLYPNGDEERNGEGHISMYLMLAETDPLPLGWEVYANLKLFVFDHTNDKFLTIQEGFKSARRFHRMKTEWGFAKLLPHSDFHDTSNGYLIRDKCIFGAEVSVSRSSRGERLTAMKNFESCYTWSIYGFSSLKEQILWSESFTLANLKWKLKLYPKGDVDRASEYLSLFLYPDEPETPDNVYAGYKLTILDQRNDKNLSLTGHRRFTGTNGWGWSEYAPLSRISDASEGF